jgi:histidine ammonia-lyase
MPDYFELNPGQLTLALIKKLLETKQPCTIAESALIMIKKSHETVRQVVASNTIVYGINTGFGCLANQTISNDNLKKLQRNIVLSHACGTGELVSDDVVSLILLLKINSLAQGYSGVRYQLIEALIALYNHQVYPCIPGKGSVGASGDLVPLAHMSLPLLGVGEVRYNHWILKQKKGLPY